MIFFAASKRCLLLLFFFFCWGKKWQEAKAFHYCFWLNHLQVVFPGTMDFIAACSAETASCDWVNSPWRLHEQESFLALEEVEKKQRCGLESGVVSVGFPLIFHGFLPKSEVFKNNTCNFWSKVLPDCHPFRVFPSCNKWFFEILGRFNLRVWRYECEDYRFFSWRKKQPLWKARKTFLSFLNKSKSKSTHPSKNIPRMPHHIKKILETLKLHGPLYSPPPKKPDPFPFPKLLIVQAANLGAQLWLGWLWIEATRAVVK